MYEEFYGFKERPFNVTPDARFFYPSAKHREALDSLYYAVSQRLGFVVITGEIGAGKTTVCRTLLKRLPATTKVAVITNTLVTGRHLLCAILDEFELPVGEREPRWKLINRLNEFLITALSHDENAVVVIDEAQNLTPSVLEEIRLLSNLETERAKLIQIILMGQPELRLKLNLPTLAQLKQRVLVSYHLQPLDLSETMAYVKHRQNRVGATASAFTPEAMEIIYNYSKGVPRLINLICERALLSGYGEQLKPIDGSFMQQVASELTAYHAGWRPEPPVESVTLTFEEEYPLRQGGSIHE